MAEQFAVMMEASRLQEAGNLESVFRSFIPYYKGLFSHYQIETLAFDLCEWGGGLFATQVSNTGGVLLSNRLRQNSLKTACTAPHSLRQRCVTAVQSREGNQSL